MSHTFDRTYTYIYLNLLLLETGLAPPPVSRVLNDNIRVLATGATTAAYRITMGREKKLRLIRALFRRDSPAQGNGISNSSGQFHTSSMRDARMNYYSIYYIT